LISKAYKQQQRKFVQNLLITLYKID